MKTPSINLVHLLIAKSIAETILVGTLAIGFFFTAFPPYYHGWGEAKADGIYGWVVNDAVPWDRVAIQIFVDENFVASGVANRSRPDVLAAGWSEDEWHGYTFPITTLATGVHEARVYAIHESGAGARKTLQLVGDPIYFSVDGNGRLTALRKQH